MGSQPLFPNQFLLVGKPPLEEFNLGLHESSLKTPRPMLHKNTPLPRTLQTDILAAEFVLLRCDGVSLPLKGRSDTVSTHRLPPILQEEADPPPC